MPTRIENMGAIRDLMGRPFPQRPSPDQMLRQMLSEEQYLVNELNDTGKPWTVSVWTLQFNPNQDTYEITASDFGKPIDILRETDDPDVPYVQVPFADLTSLNYAPVWNSFDWTGWGYAYVSPAPERFAFYRTGVSDQSAMVKIRPLPNVTATYQITYVPGYIGRDDPLASSPLLAEHNDLINLRAAAALLPFAEWYEDFKMNDMKRRSIADSIAYQLKGREESFNRYKRLLTHPRTVMCDAWDEPV